MAIQLIVDEEAAEWLSGNVSFDWDDGNRIKGRKHGINTDDVEAMFGRAFVLAGRITEPKHDEARWLVLGESGGRRLTLIFTRRGSMIRPISCRPMRPNEKKLYEEAIAKEGSEDVE